MIRIANGQGFWGDWLEAPVRLVDQGPIDFLVLDYLAEVTMSILQKQKQEDPALGYARDFPPLIGRIAKQMLDRNIRVIANAGGVNPIACAFWLPHNVSSASAVARGRLSVTSSANARTSRVSFGSINASQ